MTKLLPDSSSGIVIIYYRGRLIWLHGELTDPESVGERTAEAIREICKPCGQAQDYSGPDEPPPTLN